MDSLTSFGRSEGQLPRSHLTGFDWQHWVGIFVLWNSCASAGSGCQLMHGCALMSKHLGIKNGPDKFQEIVMNPFCDLDCASNHIDDTLIISDGTFENHPKKVQEVLSCPQKASFHANAHMCFFAQDNLECLGHQITWNGIQPQPKRLEATQKIEEPTNGHQLGHCLGVVNHYRDVWKR